MAGSSSTALFGLKGLAVSGLVVLLAVLAANVVTQVPYLRAWVLQQSAWQMFARSLFVLAVLALGQDWLLKGYSQWRLRRQAAKAPPVTADSRYRQSHLEAAQRAQARMEEAAVEVAARDKEERAAAAEVAAQAVAAARRDEERVAEAMKAAVARRAVEARESVAEGARVAEEVRAARMLRLEQDEAYQQSLRADQERAAKRLEVQEARERALAEEVEQAEARRRQLVEIQQSLPDEPELGAAGRASIRIKCRDGAIHTRAFMQDDDVEVIHNWLKTIAVIELDGEAHKLVMPYPRIELPSAGSTLAEVGLAPQAMLLLELP